MMRITWVTRSFLDYRLALYRELADTPGVEFQLLSSYEQTSPALREKTEAALGTRVEFLVGEKCFGKPYQPEQRSNSVRRVFWQPGLARKILDTKPDIVITDAFNHWTLPVLYLRGRHHFKHILCYERTAHTERNAPWLKKWFIRQVGRRVDAIHYNGVLCHDFLRTLGYPEYKLKPGNMTVDVNWLSSQCDAVKARERELMRGQMGLGDESVFLFLGRLIPLKGLQQWLVGWRAWRMNAPERKVKFLIIGQGSEERGLKCFCEENDLSDVLFVPPCRYDEVPRYFSIADVFVIPTLEDNWSLVVPEAMACRKPILCSCWNGCWPELVHEGVNGWVFDPLHTESITGALERAWLAKNRWEKMGESSRKIVKLFDPVEISSGILRTCREKTVAPTIPLIPRCIEFFRHGFEQALMKKVHWGSVVHYRHMMRLNGVRNRRAAGEKNWLAKWRELTNDVAPEDFRLYGHYISPSPNIVPESVSHNIIEAILNPADFRSLYADKNMFDFFMPREMLPKTYLRCMRGVFRNAEYQVIKEQSIDLQSILQGLTRCVVKPTVDSSSGHGVTVFEVRNRDFFALNGDLKGERLTLTVLKRFFGRDFIIQEYLEQADFMKKLCSTSVNTIRLFIYRSVKTEEVAIPAISMRFGHEGSLVDNGHAGGVSIGVDHAGNLGHYTTDQYGQRYTVVNGIDFQQENLRIPHFDRVIALAKEVGESLFHHRMANLDVMIDENYYPRLIEYNLSGMSTWLYQFGSGCAYGEYADEIIDYCRRNRTAADHVLIKY